MADLPLVVTAAGRAALVNATNSGTAPVMIASVGISATAITASTGTATLPGEIKRIATISGDVVAADTIHLTVRDAGSDIYSVRSFALYLADGTLFAAYGQASVIIEKSALSLLLLAIDVRFVDVAATSLTFGNTNFLNPPATESTEGVARFSTDAEARAGTSLTRMLSPKRAKDAILSWLGYTPASRAGDTFTGAVVVEPGNGGGGRAFLSATGDIQASRAGGQTGAYYFGASATKFLWFDGSDYRLNGGGKLFIDGGTAWTSANDGAGSGLDADLLDGQDGAYYANPVARLGFTPVRQGGGAGQGVSTVSIGWDGSGLRVQVDATDLGRFALQSWLADVWRSSNDGAGSGLDADLLDGRDGGYYTDITGRLGFTPMNRAGGFFTGAVGFGDNDFRMALSGGNSLINFDSDSYFAFLRSAKQYELSIAGARAFSVNEAGMRVDRALTVSSHITSAANLTGLNVYAISGPSTGAMFFGSNSQHYIQYDGSSWVLRGGGELYVDTGAGALARVWNGSNDGAGSGLDADLLDGRDSGYFTDIVARLGYSPANAAGQIFGGPIGPEAGFRMVFSGGNPGIQFTADGTTSVFYNRTTGYFTFFTNGRGVFDVDVNGNARFRGTVTQNIDF